MSAPAAPPGRRRTGRAIGLALVGALVVGGIAMAIGRFGDRSLRFPYLAQAVPGSSLRALATGGWEPWEVEVEPGLRLQGLLRPPAEGERRFVLHFPANNEFVLEEARRDLAALFPTPGLGLATVAWRGFDGNPGRPSPEALAHDGAAVLAALLRERGISAADVVLSGFSLGTWVALAVARQQEAAREAPAGVLLLAPMTRIRVLSKGPLARLAAGDLYDTAPLASPEGPPVLLLHGAQDDAFPSSMSLELKGRLGERAERAELAGVGHADLPTSAQARDLVARWLVGIFAAAGE